jgi:hypothetical protein
MVFSGLGILNIFLIYVNLCYFKLVMSLYLKCNLIMSHRASVLNIEMTSSIVGPISSRRNRL